MNPGTCRLAGGKQARQTGASIQISAHAAHGIVRGGPHRRGLRGNIDSVLQAGLINAREALADECGIAACKIQEHVRRPRAPQFRHDGARHHVARREFGQRVVARHEALARRVQ